MHLLHLFFETFWHLSLSIGLYVLLGLVFVGLVHLYVSEEWIKKHIGKGGKNDAFKGALLGIPLPLCSCGVIPLATSLRKKGASIKAVTSFFITTPMTGIDSIIATYGVFGLPMALLRVLSSLISGVLAGLLVKEESTIKAEDEPKLCCSSSCCAGTPSDISQSALKKAYHYAVFEVLADIAKPMLYGLVLASLFVTLIPQEIIYNFEANRLLAYAVILVLSLPVYVCSVSAIPIALSFLTYGLSPGAAFIFLAAAPATNLITAGIIKKILGTKALAVYLFSIISVTLLFALLIDFTMPTHWFISSGSLQHEGPSLLDVLAASVFIALILFFTLRSMYKQFKAS